MTVNLIGLRAIVNSPDLAKLKCRATTDRAGRRENDVPHAWNLDCGAFQVAFVIGRLRLRAAFELDVPVFIGGNFAGHAALRTASHGALEARKAVAIFGSTLLPHMRTCAEIVVDDDHGAAEIRHRRNIVRGWLLQAPAIR